VYIIKYFLGVQKIYNTVFNAMWKPSCPDVPAHTKKFTRDHYVAQVTDQSGTFDDFAHYYRIRPPIYGSSSTNVDRALPYVHVAGENPPPSMPHDYQWRLVRMPLDGEHPDRMNFAGSDIWVCSGINASGNDPSIHDVKRYKEAYADFCTKCAKVFGGVENVCWAVMKHYSTSHGCVIVAEFALDAECMRNTKPYSHLSQGRAFAGKEQEGFLSTDSSDGSTAQKSNTKPPKARTEQDKRTHASGCSPLRQRKLLMDSDIFFKVPSCFLGSELGSLLPECVSTGAPLYHSVMDRCVLGALDRLAEIDFASLVANIVTN